MGLADGIAIEKENGILESTLSAIKQEFGIISPSGQMYEDTPSLKDSGARREFGTGAVRDISDGKGRCDLLPLDTVALLVPASIGDILKAIERFKRNKDITELTYAIHGFCDSLDLDIYSLMLEVSKHYEDGAAKYSENNWMKGIDLHCYIDSGVRHLLKFSRGDTDEAHDRAFVWNMLGAIWTITHRPELDDVLKDVDLGQNVRDILAT